MKSVNRAKLDLIIAVTAFGTIGIFVRYINLPSSVIAFVRGAVGAVFLLLLLCHLGSSLYSYISYMINYCFSQT